MNIFIVYTRSKSSDAGGKPYSHDQIKCIELGSTNFPLNYRYSRNSCPNHLVILVTLHILDGCTSILGLLTEIHSTNATASYKIIHM